MATIVGLINIILGLSLAYLDLRFFLRNPHEYWRWIKLAYSMMGLYWAGLYIYIVVAHLNDHGFGATFIRPAVTVTLGVWLAGAIIRQKKGN